ncbi:hypothetical protein DKL61_08685 [Gammaproteobacteria bacterium ESL0073]|uniref:Uncharacterized protein n=1 Tax=Entomomonas moraniae TaxID=2213226 RepID=A0A3S9XDE3_9GAMM|nr:hypothetical protein [Entomomonas moraniae]AWM80428.1 hypothetical protein DKL61_08685 [Gammaproteobacteria bacterium ESL0073]AZS50443.1 hypothetical protein DM558_06475 [Entomomonas moraniae]
MKKLLLIMTVGLLSTQVSANNVDNNSNARYGYNPIKIVLVGEAETAYGLKICTYQKLKFNYVLAQFSKVVPKRISCPVIGPQY